MTWETKNGGAGTPVDAGAGTAGVHRADDVP